MQRKVARNENYSKARSSAKEPERRSNQKESKDRQSDRSLSYSPARRNPERYKEILESKNKSHEKPRKQTGPVVKLQSDNESSDDEQNTSVKVDEFLIDKNQDKELNRLKALKTELAAKVKESLEKKISSEALASSSQNVESRQKSSPEFPPESNSNRKHDKTRDVLQATIAVAKEEKQPIVKSHGRDTSSKKRKVSKSPDKDSARSSRRSRSRSSRRYSWLILKKINKF